MSVPALAQAVVYASATSGTTIAATFGSSTTNGNAILVLVDAFNSGGSITVTNVQVNAGTASFSKIKAQIGTTSYASCEAWVAYTITGGATPKVTVTMSGTINTADIAIYEWQNVASSEGAAGGTGTTSGGIDTANALTTTNANDVLFAFISTTGSCTAYSSGWPSTPTFKQTTQNASGICYLVVSSTVSAAACAMADASGSSFGNIVFALSAPTAAPSNALNWDSSATKWDDAFAAWDAGQALTWDSPIALWNDTNHVWDEGNDEWDSSRIKWNDPLYIWDVGAAETWDSRAPSTTWDSNVINWDNAAFITPTIVQHVASGMDCNPIGNLKIYFPNPTLVNNTLIIGFQYSTTGSVSSVTDDVGNTYTAGPTASNSTYGQAIASYYCVSAQAGVTYIQATFSGLGTAGNFYGTQGVITEVAGISGVDGSTASNNSVSPGTLTPTQPGDFIYYWAVDIQSFSDGASLGGAYNGTSITAGTGFTPISCDLQVGSFDQYKVQPSGSVSPTCTPSGSKTWSSLAIAFINGNGTLPSSTAMRVVHVQHTLVGSLSTSTNSPPIPLAFPSQGNLLVGMWNTAPAGAFISSVTDSASNTWSTPAAIQISGGSGKVQIVYAANATTSPTLHNVLITSNSSFQQMFVLFDVVNAAASPYDTGITNSGNQTTAGNLNGGTITPTQTGGIVFYTTAISFGTIAGVSLSNGTGIFDTAVNNLNNDNPGIGSGNSPLDEDNGYGHVYNTNSSAITFTWSFTATSPAAAGWGSVAASFKAPSTTVLNSTWTINPATGLSLPGRQIQPASWSINPGVSDTFKSQSLQNSTWGSTPRVSTVFGDQVTRLLTVSINPAVSLLLNSQVSGPNVLNSTWAINPTNSFVFNEQLLIRTAFSSAPGVHLGLVIRALKNSGFHASATVSLTLNEKQGLMTVFRINPGTSVAVTASQLNQAILAINPRVSFRFNATGGSGQPVGIIHIFTDGTGVSRVVVF